MRSGKFQFRLWHCLVLMTLLAVAVAWWMPNGTWRVVDV